MEIIFVLMIFLWIFIGLPIGLVIWSIWTSFKEAYFNEKDEKDKDGTEQR